MSRDVLLPVLARTALSSEEELIVAAEWDNGTGTPYVCTVESVYTTDKKGTVSRIPTA